MKTDDLIAIGNQLQTQDNRITQHPMFCVQILKREVGYDSGYSDNKCWWHAGNMELIYDDDPDFKEPDGDDWDGPFGYKDTWETVMVAFTQIGCEEYLRLNGHNHKAFRGQVRIYAESFCRCPEMIAIREHLISLATVPKTN